MIANNPIHNKINSLIKQQKGLFHEKKRKLDCYYYLKQGKQKKLIFYINPQKQGTIFGIGHYGNDIQDPFPFLRSMADETKQSVLKRKIKEEQEIISKGIPQIIEIITKYLFEKNQ